MTDATTPDLAANFARLGRLERKMAVVEHRVGQMETVPTRVTKLEQQFEHLAGQLSELNEGQQKLTSVVSGLGTKITWALAVASTLWAVLQMIGPTLLRVVFP
ncbi:hypothetical protein [Pseudomonas sp. RGB]|nr:hypothetical protein [Pseudomonas sp. RGB]